MPVPCFSQCAAHTHHTCSRCRVAFYTQLRFVNRTQKACSLQQILRIIRSAQVGSTLVCKLYPARYGQAEDVMTASLSSRTQQTLAVDISELDSKLVTATEGSKFGLVCCKSPTQTCGIHSGDSYPELLSGVTCQGNVISIHQNPHQHLLCGLLAMHELAIYLIADGDAKLLQLW